MFIKTHLAISFFVVLIFIGLFNSFGAKLIFIFSAFISTFLPDIDSRFSKLGKRKFFRPLQFFFGHRGAFHSFSLLTIISVLLFFWKPVVAVGFFVGYGTHIFADGFTKIGIYPFWPSKRKFKGFIKTGGKFEIFLLVLFVVLDFFLLVFNIYSGAL